MNYVSDHGQWRHSGHRQAGLPSGIAPSCCDRVESPPPAGPGSAGDHHRERWTTTSCSTSPRSCRWKTTIVSQLRLRPQRLLPDDLPVATGSLNTGWGRRPSSTACKNRSGAVGPHGLHRFGHMPCPRSMAPRHCRISSQLARRWIKRVRPAREGSASAGRTTWSGNWPPPGNFSTAWPARTAIPTSIRSRISSPNIAQGHCEYFATALTLMLRSQRIPARMVVGYQVRRDGIRWADTTKSASCTPTPGSRRISGPTRFRVRPRCTAEITGTGRRRGQAAGCGSIRRPPGPGPTATGLVHADPPDDWIGWIGLVELRGGTGMRTSAQRHLRADRLGGDAEWLGSVTDPGGGGPCSMPSPSAALPGSTQRARPGWRPLVAAAARRGGHAGCRPVLAALAAAGAGCGPAGQETAAGGATPAHANRVLSPVRDPAGPAGHGPRRRRNPTRIRRRRRACDWPP